MNATPGAGNEYSRGSEASRRASVRGERRFGRLSRPLSHRFHGPPAVVGRGARTVIVAGALLGALLMLVAEFTVLYRVRVAATSTPIESVSGGSNHSYAFVPLALLAALLAYGAVRGGSRTALLALGLVGVVALLIALLGDLPDAHATGLVGSATTQYVNASSTPSAGLYMETLGAVLLIATCGVGLLMLGPAGPATRERFSRPAGAG